MSFLFNKKSSAAKRTNGGVGLSRGFTLFEMMVSITIFVLLAAVLLARNNEFQGTTVMTNLTYELALEIRQAQVYGVDVQACTASEGCAAGVQPEAFTHAYGIHWSNASSGIFDLFVDTNDNLYYDPSSVNSINPDPSPPVQTSTLPLGYSVLKVCVINLMGSLSCSDAPPNQVNSLDITFKRPNPDAVICINAAQGTPCDSQTEMSSASIYLTSTSGQVREIDVYSTGEISVNESPTVPVQ